MTRRLLAVAAFVVAACAHDHPPVESQPPVVHHDPSCLPVSPTVSPVDARKQAELLKRLVKATEGTDPEMPALLHRLAERHFDGGFVSRGCDIAEVAIRVAPDRDAAVFVQLRADHCFDGRAKRCTTWFEPRPVHLAR